MVRREANEKDSRPAITMFVESLVARTELLSEVETTTSESDEYEDEFLRRPKA